MKIKKDFVGQLPSKVLFGNTTIQVIIKRKEALAEYIECCKSETDENIVELFSKFVEERQHTENYPKQTSTFQISEDEWKMFCKIVKHYAATEEELQDYMNLPTAKKLKILHEWKDSQTKKEDTRRESDGKTSRRGTMLDLTPNPALNKLTEAESVKYGKIVRGMSKTDEQYDEYMSSSVEDKRKLLENYKSVRKSLLDMKREAPSILELDPNIGSPYPRKNVFVRLFSSPSDSYEDGEEESPQKSYSKRYGEKETFLLSAEEELIYRCFANIQSAGNQDKYEIYMNMELDQKITVLRSYLELERKAELKHQAAIKLVPFDKHYKGFKINFYSIFLVTEMLLAFYKHLQKEVNTEQIDFVLEINRMDNKVTERSISTFYHLINEFIKSDAVREINVSGMVKQTFLKKLEKEGEGNKSWNSIESPKQVLDELRVAILADLKMDAWSRFTASEDGYRVIQRNWNNPNVISLQPKHAVKYKLERSMAGITVTGIDLDELADILSDPKLILQKYLSSDWNKTVEFEKHLNQTYHGDSIEFVDPKVEFEKKILANKRFEKKNVKVKIVVMNHDKKKLLQKNAAKYFGPILEFIQPSQDYGIQTSLMIGPWLFQFVEDEICIPKRCLTTTTLVSLDYDEIDVSNFDYGITKVANVIAEWNSNREFKDEHTSQEFIDELLVAVGSKSLQSNLTLSNLIKRLKGSGSSLLTLKVEKSFVEQFELKSDTITFQTHREVDEFYEKCIEISPIFDDEHPETFLLLKSFDRAFWMKHLYLEREIHILKHKITELEKDLTLKMVRSEKDPNLERELNILRSTVKKYQIEDYPNTPEDDNCPFGNPISSNSIVF